MKYITSEVLSWKVLLCSQTSRQWPVRPWVFISVPIPTGIWSQGPYFLWMPWFTVHDYGLWSASSHHAHKQVCCINFLSFSLERPDRWKCKSKQLPPRAGCEQVAQQLHSSWLYPRPPVFSLVSGLILPRYIPSWVTQVVGALSCTPKMWVQFPVEPHT